MVWQIPSPVKVLKADVERALNENIFQMEETIGFKQWFLEQTKNKVV